MEEDDTKYRKIFVGGLAWKTRRDTLVDYFKQFGEIEKANVVFEKGTGRSSGYGFVTFKKEESASRAVEDMQPVIDGRRTDCRLAYLGSRQHGMRSTCPEFHQQHIGQFAFPYYVYGTYPVAGTGTGVYYPFYYHYNSPLFQYPYLPHQQFSSSTSSSASTSTSDSGTNSVGSSTTAANNTQK